MNRVCLNKNGKLIEMQSGGDDRPDLMEMRLDTLKQNAINSGYLEADIEVKWVTDAEWETIQESQKDPVAELRKQIVIAVQNHMDTTAQTRNYDNIHTLASYENSLDSTFKAEGTAGRVWRDEVWITCRQILNDVQQGLRPMPTLNEVLAELPNIEW